VVETNPRTIQIQLCEIQANQGQWAGLFFRFGWRIKSFSQ
jgi:hypothetical protein